MRDKKLEAAVLDILKERDKDFNNQNVICEKTDNNFIKIDLISNQDLDGVGSLDLFKVIIEQLIQIYPEIKQDFIYYTAADYFCQKNNSRWRSEDDEWILSITITSEKAFKIIEKEIYDLRSFIKCLKEFKPTQELISTVKLNSKHIEDMFNFTPKEIKVTANICLEIFADNSDFAKYAYLRIQTKLSMSKNLKALQLFLLDRNNCSVIIYSDLLNDLKKIVLQKKLQFNQNLWFAIALMSKQSFLYHLPQDIKITILVYVFSVKNLLPNQIMLKSIEKMLLEHEQKTKAREGNLAIKSTTSIAKQLITFGKEWQSYPKDRLGDKKEHDVRFFTIKGPDKQQNEEQAKKILIDLQYKKMNAKITHTRNGDPSVIVDLGMN